MTIDPAPPKSQVDSDSSAIYQSLSVIRGIVGTERVAEYAEAIDGAGSPVRPNVGMFRSRAVHGTVRPRTVDDVRRIVDVFAGPEVTCGLHAISTGRNWGLGSREPAGDHAVILDLSGLDQIRELDVDRGYAVVEPGVTQGRLADLLAGTSRMLNLTASSAHTSVVGNGLDRGVGLRRQRVDDLVGLEVVLPDGRLVRVGWWPVKDRSTAVYPHGLGPSPMPLFMQSDLGIVTAAVVQLLPRPEAQRVLRMAFSRENLVPAVDELRRWKAQGLVGGVLKIYDLVSAEFYGGSAGGFLAHLCVDGTTRTVEAVCRILAEEAEASGLFTGIERSGGATDDHDVVADMVAGAYSGDPGHNDRMLEATLGQPAELVDAHGLGWLFFLPLIPFSGEYVSRAHRLLEQINEETGVRAGCTVNALSSDVIDFVVSVKFRRDVTSAERAHHALDRAYRLFSAEGFIPYRLDVDHAEWIDRLSPDAGSRELVRQLKSALDPAGVIARGRYS